MFSTQQDYAVTSADQIATRAGLRGGRRLQSFDLDGAFGLGSGNINFNFIEIVEVDLIVVGVAIDPSEEVDFVVEVAETGVVTGVDLEKIGSFHLRPAFTGYVEEVETVVDLDAIGVYASVENQVLVYREQGSRFPGTGHGA